MKLEEIYRTVGDSIKRYSLNGNCFDIEQVRNRTEIICKDCPLFGMCNISKKHARISRLIIGGDIMTTFALGALFGFLMYLFMDKTYDCVEDAIKESKVEDIKKTNRNKASIDIK